MSRFEWKGGAGVAFNAFPGSEFIRSSDAAVQLAEPHLLQHDADVTLVLGAMTEDADDF